MDQFEEKKWFVFLGDHHEGPFSMAEMLNKVGERIVTPSSFVWAEGMTDWKLLKEIPAFENVNQNGPGASAQKASQAPARPAPSLPVSSSPSAAEPTLNSAIVTLQLDKTPLAAQTAMTHDQIEKSWKRRKLIRNGARAAFGVASLGIATIVYQRGFLDTYIDKVDTSQIVASAQSISRQAMDQARPYLLELSEKYPILSKIISPIPRLKDVSSEEFETLRSAAMAHLEQNGPAVAIVASRSDASRPVFYVASNLPDGARFDIYLEGARETLVGRLSANSKITVTISKNFAQTDPVQLRSGSLPMGEYQVAITESEKQSDAIATILKPFPALDAANSERLPHGLKILARKAYFLGGVKDDAYSQKLRAYHAELQQKARVELADLKDLSAVLEKQIQSTIKEFKKLYKGRAPSATKRKSWSDFHTDWIKKQIAWLDRFSKLTPDVLKDEYVYADGYESAREAGAELQKLHDMQNDFFENRLDQRALDIQLGTATSVVDSAFAALRAKIELAEKKGT